MAWEVPKDPCGVKPGAAVWGYTGLVSEGDNGEEDGGLLKWLGLGKPPHHMQS